jgi:hypothetical protein
MLPNFTQKLVTLAPNDRERAKLLGVSPRTITDYKAGKFPRILIALAEWPELAQALLSDAQALKEKAEHE